MNSRKEDVFFFASPHRLCLQKQKVETNSITAGSLLSVPAPMGVHITQRAFTE